MDFSRRGLLASVAATLAPLPAFSAGGGMEQAHHDLMFGSPETFFDALQTIRDRGNADMVPGLIFAMRFLRGDAFQLVETLKMLTGENNAVTWRDWMLWQEAHPEITPHPSFIGFKRKVFLQIDPNFDVFLKPEYLSPDAMEIRLEEVTWGGVRKDGIPSLDNPTLIDAIQADYLLDDDLVFGVSINGDTRAYPLRIMGWHEMFNEVIGGVSVALAYCTLCGSGILFETQVQGREKPFVFGSSGFLYRSNKLMFDRETHSLWNQFTGKPVVGSLVGSGIELRQRPVVITSWKDWKSQNPDTRVLSLDTGVNRDYGAGVVYKDYFASPDLMFPVVVDQSLHRQKDYVFGIRKFGAAKAWPMTAFKGGRVINDAIGDTALVVIGDQGTRTARAYERGDLEFNTEGEGLVSKDGTLWALTEDALSAPDGRTLPRVAGHIAYWFAWNGYLGAEAELYSDRP